MDTHREAFDRALSWWCQRGEGGIDPLLNRIIFEARGSLSGDARGVALLLKRRGAPFLVARGEEAPLLPVETLLSLFVDHQGAHGGCRVRDHALDTVRFIEARFRTSIMVSLTFPVDLAARAECVLWIGLQGCASAETISSAEALARCLGQWLAGSAGIITGFTQAIAQHREGQRRMAELQALLHDARAPLGVLRYLVGNGGVSESSEIVARELEYLDQILGQGSPRGNPNGVPTSDIGAILSRVARRYSLEVGSDRIRIERGYEDVATSISEIDVERVVTNLVSNAFRHSPRCHVTISLESLGDRAIVIVRDTGCGIPRDILEAIERDQSPPERATSGWGIGLRSCRAKLRSLGADLLISSEVGAGTIVRLSLPRVSRCVAQPVSYVAEPFDEPPTPIEVAIIDDDHEHSASLDRLLRRYGVSARQFGSVDSFMGKSSRGELGIVLCDAHMPDGGAERLLTLLADRPRSPRVAVMSGDVNDDYLYKVSALGAQAFFSKPVDLSEVCTWIREVQGMTARG